MRWVLIILLFGAGTAARAAPARAPLYDSARLNIGLNCQWQRQCIVRQQQAMYRALSYVRQRQPPVWRVHLCNRNASRAQFRVDWIGFDNCIRNAALRRPARAGQLRGSKTFMTRA